MELNSVLPHVMVVINVGTVLALISGWRAIKAGDKARHQVSMKTAVGLGMAFLVLYAIYHLGAGLARFGGEGLIRPIYFTLLIVHIIAAAVAALVIPVTVYRALTGQFEKHRAIAPKTWKLWMFVALSGITVYVMTNLIWPYQGPDA